MGQKVNPIGLRLGFNKIWTSHWFSDKNYAAFLQEDALIKTTIAKRYRNSGVAQIDIYRSRGDLTVSILSSKPGVIIGRSGVGAQDLRATLERLLFRKIEGKTRPTLRINILELKTPELSAQIVAENIANQIERRISVKRAMKQSIERTIEKKALGIKIRVSGRINGAEIARSEIQSSGSIPLQTIRSDISYAQAEAHTTFGIVGVKVWIYLGPSETLPSEITPKSPKSV
jgi:small subunit ribosomal protein S3